MSKLLKIGDVAHALKRVPHTVRIWDISGRLPENLRPSRDERGQRVWTEEQLEGLKAWVIEADLRPGKGLTTTKGKQ